MRHVSLHPAHYQHLLQNKSGQNWRLCSFRNSYYVMQKISLSVSIVWSSRVSSIWWENIGITILQVTEYMLIIQIWMRDIKKNVWEIYNLDILWKTAIHHGFCIEHSYDSMGKHSSTFAYFDSMKKWWVFFKKRKRPICTMKCMQIKRRSTFIFFRFG
jgi:hypothetical protein